jgi:hypothetical protein
MTIKSYDSKGNAKTYRNRKFSTKISVQVVLHRSRRLIHSSFALLEINLCLKCWRPLQTSLQLSRGGYALLCSRRIGNINDRGILRYVLEVIARRKKEGETLDEIGIILKYRGYAFDSRKSVSAEKTVSSWRKTRLITHRPLLKSFMTSRNLI